MGVLQAPPDSVASDDGSEVEDSILGDYNLLAQSISEGNRPLYRCPRDARDHVCMMIVSVRDEGPKSPTIRSKALARYH